MKVCTLAEMKELDETAQKEFGISQEILMENAGSAVAEVCIRETNPKKVVVVCGSGNNGGDGFVAARHLLSRGREVTTILIGDSSKLKGSSQKNYERLSRTKSKPINTRDPNCVKNELKYADAAIDAIFGTGLSKEVQGIYAEIINLINSSSRPIVSVDIPSGINGDTGLVKRCAVKASHTVTMGAPKTGNLLYPGASYCGRLWVARISFPPELYNSEKLKVETNRPCSFVERPRNAHKGNFGKALFVSGSAKYLGAPYFSTMSFLRAGGGLAYLAAPKSISTALASKGSEIVVLPQAEDDKGSLTMESYEELIGFSSAVDFVVIGPGVSLSEGTKEFVRKFASKIGKPCLIDGDGLTAISEKLEVLKERRAPTILTPHLGEMSKLTGKSIDEIKTNKLEILRESCVKLQAIIVLKGAHSLIGSSDGRVYINLSGNPGMSTAGSGDVLTGTIAAMYGLGLDVEKATKMGVLLHGHAGDLASVEYGEDGMIAGDILRFLPAALKNARIGTEELDQDKKISIV
jgi:NAD(P)H-hydrate epimerase